MGGQPPVSRTAGHPCVCVWPSAEPGPLVALRAWCVVSGSHVGLRRARSLAGSHGVF